MPDPLLPPETKSQAPYLQYQNLSRYHQLKHGTFTRHGGISNSPYASLNISDEVGDCRKDVAGNLKIIQNTMDAERIFFTRQTHGTEILLLSVEATEASETSCRADSMMTNIPGLGLMIKQADCQAVILFDPRKNVVANVHCGWRGNVQNILGRVIRKMAHHFDCDAAHLVAAITPSLGPCCAEFTTHSVIFPSTFEDFMVTENHFDLWALSTHQMVTAGVHPDNITVSGICTRCHTDRFFSYRGEGKTGRFGTVAMLTQQERNASKMPTKYIIVTGGVLSGLGKGIAAASMGHLLSSKLKIVPIKCDGYLNVDPGTMNPFEHGEVFVLEDGAEVDMDFGHYERFLGVCCKSNWNLTMGKVFNMVRKKERRGDYLGKTVQYIPHVTDLIKDQIGTVVKEESPDLVIVEIGGTVGDIENELFLEAMRQMKKDVGRNNILFVHLTYVPIPAGVNEQKSKPTQQSVNLLQQRGIFPDIIIGRSPEFLTPEIKAKISNFCDVKPEAVITGLDVDDIYEIPIIFEREGLPENIHKKLNIYSPPDLRKWKKLVDNIRNPDREITIAMCGKYTKLEDSYASIIESFHHCSAHLRCKINLKWVETTEFKDASSLDRLDGLVVPGGFGSRGTEGKIEAIRLAREQNIPFLGLCLGLQLAVIEFARHVCHLDDANSTEMDPETHHAVIDILPEQRTVTEKGGTMRLGAYPALLSEGSVVHALYGSKEVSERHRHRYEVNPEYHEALQEKGMVFSGMSPNGKLVEFIELPELKFFCATQAHPELKSHMETPSPLFFGFVKACMDA